jgi:hypothetical protein
MTPEERLNRIENNIDKQNEAIRSLIVVARTVLDSIRETRENHDADYKRLSTKIEEMVAEMRESQAGTDEKLNILVETVDRIIRRENHP